MEGDVQGMIAWVNTISPWSSWSKATCRLPCLVAIFQASKLALLLAEYIQATFQQDLYIRQNVNRLLKMSETHKQPKKWWTNMTKLKLLTELHNVHTDYSTPAAHGVK